MPTQVRKRIGKTGKVSYQIRVQVGPRDANGKRKYINETYERMTDAKARIEELKYQRRNGTIQKPNRQTVTQFLDYWLKAIKPNVRPRTHSGYDDAVRLYLKPELGDVKLAKLTKQHVRLLLATLHEKRKLSPRSIAKVRTVLHTALELAVSDGLLTNNVAKLQRKDLPKQKRTERVVFDRAAAAKFTEAVRGHPKETLWLTLLMTGLRPAEALALRWPDIEGNRISVQRTLVERGGPRRFEEPKTAGSRRSVPMPSQLVQALEKHRRGQAKARLAAGKYWGGKWPKDLVFCNDLGEPLQQTALRKPFKTILRRAKLPEMRIYDLRHSQATLLLAAGESPKVVAERLGHSSTTLTLNTYSHVLPDMQERAVAKLEEMFG